MSSWMARRSVSVSMAPEAIASSGSEALDAPSRRRGRIAPVPEPVVETEGPALPELDRVGDEAVAAPVRRARHLRATEPFLLRGDPALELVAIVDHSALGRRPRADLGPPRPRGEVGVGLAVGPPFAVAGHRHLAIELAPQDDECRVRVLGELPALPALNIGVEDEPALVGRAQQDV